MVTRCASPHLACADAPFTLIDWNDELFGGVASEDVDITTLDIVATCQIAASGRPTVGSLVQLCKTRGSATLAGRVGEIIEDKKGSETPFTLKG